MKLPYTRRRFLGATLGALVAAPLAVRAAAASNLPTITLPQPIPCGTPSLSPVRVEGLAIKVPSNRWHRCVDDVHIVGQPLRTVVEYQGEWHGTFKLERDCANPAYVLASLTPAGRDWVLCDDQGDLNWAMLYDYGRWCDETVAGPCECRDSYRVPVYGASSPGPRLIVNTNVRSLDRLREDLRMHCLSWQASDPRWRTSYPGIPYPEAGA